MFSVPFADGFPEPANDLVGFLVAAVVGVFFPVVDINVGDTADEELEFAFVEDVDEIGGDKLVETGDEGVELGSDTLLDAPFREESRLREAV